jgi:threonine aldolase
MLRIADFRSDTVTKPTPAMRKAMAEAEVGDDVYGEDPTVRKLEERTAEILGKEAALFVPSGSMGNQVSLRVYGRSGTEVILESKSHIFHYEMGAMAALSGLLPRPVEGPAGHLTRELIEPWVRPESLYYVPRTSVVALENSHNLAGGAILRDENVAGILALAREKGLKAHLDGARIWNVAAARGVPEATLADGFDSVMVCFSKGLRAPVGSAVAGSKEYVGEARRVRKLFGGGMRQVGVIAAAALVALEHERSRLTIDHRRARRLAEALAEIPGVRLDPSTVETNILFVGLDPSVFGDAPALVLRLGAAGVLCNAGAPDAVRLVTHADVGEADVDRAVAAFREAAGRKSGA